MTTNAWYYAAGETQNGPFTFDQIRDLLRDRTIDRDTYVWASSLKEWTPLGQTELASLLGPPPRLPGAPPVSPQTASAAGAMGGAFAAAGKLGEWERGEGFPGVMLRAARTCIQVKYVNFRGRASRAEFWWYELFAFCLLILAEILDAVLRQIIGIGVIYLLLAFALFLPGLGAGIRRLHDTNRSAWWLLVSLVPLVGLIVLIVLLCLPSDEGENRYGPKPGPV